MKTCYACGATKDLHEESYYDPILKRDTTDYFCDDLDGCLDRKLARFFKQKGEIINEKREDN